LPPSLGPTVQATPTFGKQTVSSGGQPPSTVTPAPSSGARSGPSLLMAALVGALVSALVATGLFFVFPDRSSTTQVVRQATQANAVLSGTSLNIAGVLEKVRPSVVTIKTTSRTAGGLEAATGSGIVLSADGLVLTNAHVIEGATSIEVEYADGSPHQASLVGEFQANDVALVKAEGVSDAVPAELGSSDAANVGDDVVAIGNALNLGAQPTVTRGIISALDRTIEAPNETLEHLIQTDAAINPGNSGGPLVNAEGKVIGINTAIIENSQSLGFSLAIDEIKPLIEDIKVGKGEQGSAPANRGILGVRTTNIADQDGAVREQFGVTRTDGAFVVGVEAGSGAEAAGIAEGDVIIKIDDRTVSSKTEVVNELRRKKPGDKVSIVVDRAGQEQTLEATLGS